MANKLVIGNWKMNGRSESVRALATALRHDIRINRKGVGLAPPTPYLGLLQEVLSGSQIDLVAQDVSQFHRDGAYTGEYSPAMLLDCGCRYVLIGHSERRRYLGEQNPMLRAKLQHAIEAGLTPVLCVGETLDERASGRENDVIGEQLAILAGCSAQQLIVAYEPIWAIGTGRVASSEQIAAMHGNIRARCLQWIGGNDKIRVLYGGSVNSGNATDILLIDNVDGALVGGASLDVESLACICQAAKLVYNGTSEDVNLGC